MSMKLIGRRPVQYALEGYAKPGDTYITFPDSGEINPTPNRYQVRPGKGLCLVTLTASDPGTTVRFSIQDGVTVSGTGTASICARIGKPELWILSTPDRGLEREMSYVLTITKPVPPLRNCKILALVGVVLNGFTQNRHHPRRGGIHPHRRFRLAHPHRQESNMGNDWGNLHISRTGHLPHRGAAKCRPVQPLTVGERGQHHNTRSGGVLRGEATVLPVQRGTEDHQTVAVLGGGRRGA